METMKIKGTISPARNGRLPGISKLFIIIASFMWIGGITGGVIYALFVSVLVGSILTVSSIVSGGMFFAIAKMLDLLEQIANNTEKMKFEAKISNSNEEE